MTLADAQARVKRQRRRTYGPMSYEEFLRADLPHPHFEWVDGRAVEMPAVNDAHERVYVWLVTLLSMFVESRDLGEIFTEPFQMKTGPDLAGRAPDLFFVAKKNAKRVKRMGLRGAADLVVEIISPGSRTTDRRDKYREYEQGGVREYWLTDPMRQQAEFFQRERGKFRPAAIDEEGIYHSEVLPGVWLDVQWLWDLPNKARILKKWGVS